MCGALTKVEYLASQHMTTLEALYMYTMSSSSLAYLSVLSVLSMLIFKGIRNTCLGLCETLR